MYGSSWMLLRGFGAMNGFRGAAGPPFTFFGVAVEPSNCGTRERWRSVIGTTGIPGVCARATPAQHAQATSVDAATSPSRVPQPLWRIGRRAYGRLVPDGPKAARAHPRSQLPHEPLRAGS